MKTSEQYCFLQRLVMESHAPFETKKEILETLFNDESMAQYREEREEREALEAAQ